MATIRLPANGWAPRKHQRRLWDYLERGGTRAIEIAHRRWGKDDVCLHRAAIAAHERVGSYWHLLPEYNQARKAIWAAVNPHTGKRRIDETFPKELRASTNEQEMFIRFRNGSTWQVVGSDNYDSLVGSSVAGVVFSEFALSNPSSWAFIAPILAENNGWAVFITTPRGRNHAKSMLDMAYKSPQWFAEVSTVADTGAISLDSVEAQRIEYHAMYGVDAGDALIEQEYYCSFEAALLGAYWGKEMSRAEREGRIADVSYEPELPVYTAWDLGVGDSTAIWFFQVHFNQVRVIDYYEAAGYGADHYAEVLNTGGYLDTDSRFVKCINGGAPYDAYGDDWVPHDAKVREWGTARTRVETLIGLKRKPRLVPAHRLDDGINAGRQTINLAVFDEMKCAKGLEALRQYRREWDDEKKVFADKPLHNWASHPSDAWRYLSMAWREIKPEPVKPAAPPKGIMDMTWDQALSRQRPERRRV